MVLDGFDAFDLGTLQTIGAAGERLSADLVRELQEHVCEVVVNSYAATEAVVTMIQYEGRSDKRIDTVSGTVGKPVPGTRVRVVDPNGTPDDELPAGEVGEIIVRNTDTPVWAWNDTQRIETTFEDGWWYSGDLGYVDEAGYLFLEGRTDFMIKSKGIKVPPGPIENRLENHPAVDEAGVVGVPDEEYGEKVTAIVRTPDEALPQEELDEWCLADDALARHERPRQYRITTDPLPRTVTGKLDRDTVREQVSGGTE